MGELRLNCSGSEQGQVADSCEHDSKTSGSIRNVELVGCWLAEKRLASHEQCFVE